MTGIRITLTRMRMPFDPSIATITALYRCQGMKNPTIACSPTLLAGPKKRDKRRRGIWAIDATWSRISMWPADSGTGALDQRPTNGSAA